MSNGTPKGPKRVAIIVPPGYRPEHVHEYDQLVCSGCGYSVDAAIMLERAAESEEALTKIVDIYDAFSPHESPSSWELVEFSEEVGEIVEAWKAGK